MPSRIQRQRTRGWKMPEGTVYVGRPTVFGNPYWYIGDLKLSLALFRETATGCWNPTLVKELADVDVDQIYRDHCAWLKRIGHRSAEHIICSLKGNNLACWCPLEDAKGNRVPCHADILIELANGLERRTHVYVMRPKAYEISGCECGNADPDWSEFKRHLWCPKCRIDFVPKHGGIFDGPIPVETTYLLGISLDTICIETGEIVSGRLPA